MKKKEIVRCAWEFIALAKQKNFPRQAAKRSLFGDTREQTYCLTEKLYKSY